MSNFQWTWCWHCNSATISGNNWNLCCARWLSNSEKEINDEQQAILWSKNNPAPTCPTANDIDAKINCEGYTEEEILIFRVLDGFTYGRYYWLPKQWSDKIGHTIPSYEELSAKYGFEPKYDCKTGKQWSIDENKNVYEKAGWISEENFEQEEIPYSEFCRRMRLSKIIYNKKQ